MASKVTIYLNDGNPRYKVRYDIESEDGKRKTKSKTFESESDADDFVADLDYKRRHAIPLSLDSDGPEDLCHTMPEMFDKFQTDYLDVQNLARGTRVLYEEAFRLYLKPFFGEMPVRDIDFEVLTALYRSLITPAADGSWKGLERRTAKEIMSKLKTVFREAMKWKGWVEEDPWVNFHTPAFDKRDYLVLSAEQLKALLAEMKDHPAECVIKLASAGGLRSGECNALTWQHVDFEENKILVRESRHYIGGHGLVTGVPKTLASVRDVDMPAEVMAWLEARYRDFVPSYEGLGLDPGSQYVCGKSDGRPVCMLWVAKALKSGLKRTGYKDFQDFRVHDLRHTFASLLLRKPVGVPAVSHQLGHASPQITMALYAHFIKGDGRLAADAMGDILS